MKLFLKIFDILLVSELLLGILGIFLSQGIMPAFAESIGKAIIIAISLPLSLINRMWPFYIISPLWFGFMLFAVNVLVHTAIVYIIITNRRRAANKIRE